MKILISVVTYNRLEFLQKLINSLRNQTYKHRDILIVNNSSTDNTYQWLNAQNGLIVINQQNVGSSGGQFTAFQYAKDNGYEAIWAMDDDVLPENNCLELLLMNYSNDRIICPIRYDNKGKIFYNETKVFNLTNPFATMWKEIINHKDIANELVKVEGPTFEGPLIPIRIIKDIGLPDKQFFIFGDDSEYFLRAKSKSYLSYIYTKARLNRQLEAPKNEISFGWKEYYSFRNMIIIDVLYGNMAVRIIRPILYLFKYISKSKSIDNLKTSLKAFKDGYWYKQKIDN